MTRRTSNFLLVLSIGICFAFLSSWMDWGFRDIEYYVIILTMVVLGFHIGNWSREHEE